MAGFGTYTRIVAIFVGSVCVGSGYLLGESGVVIPLQANGLYQLLDDNELTISVRVGSSAEDDFFINGGNADGDRKLGGSQKATLTIREATRVS